MGKLHEKLAQQIPGLRNHARSLINEHGSTVISEVTVSQVFGGMRGIKGLVCDTSVVDPDRGLIVRGIPIGDLMEKLPEEIFFLLLTGELPNAEELASLQEDFRQRAKVPSCVWDVLKALPSDSHPMTMFATGILAMERESEFRRRYSEGMRKEDYWEPALDDALTLLARLPQIAAEIYRLHTGKGDRIPANPDLDWGGNYASMLGLPDPDGEFKNYIRLYLTIHCDHEGGNVSAFSCHTVGSALSDPFYAVAAGMSGLAGPLHGLANQEGLHFVLGIHKRYNGNPTDDQIAEYVRETLESGRVIPGYGHAVLRATDPRFTACHKFGLRVCPNDEVFRIVDRLFNVTPGILKEHPKIKDPWPNVDAGSGSLLYRFGLREFAYYTVLFGVSRALGMCSQLVLNRALGSPITRPKSVSTKWIMNTVSSSANTA